MDELSERLERCYTGVIHDVMRGMGVRDFVFPPEICPIMPERTMAGPAFTVEGKVDLTADPHETLLQWTGLLSKARRGCIWVSQPNDRTVAHMGELSAETLKLRGLRGCLLDGAARDIRFLLDMQFQTWCRNHTPRDIVGYWLPVRVDQAIRIGDVTVNADDYIVADRDGALCIPKAIALDVATAVEAAIGKENKVRTAILAGEDPQRAYLQFGKF
jgi:4-hydroxy-4-methyl-2-oxoglutarate aldolase